MEHPCRGVFGGLVPPENTLESGPLRLVLTQSRQIATSLSRVTTSSTFLQIT